jgi:nitrogen fixation NifU-like protein
MTEETIGSSDVDRFAEQLQEEILQKARRRYSPPVIRHWMSPTNLGRMTDYDGYGRVIGWCGDSIEIYIRVMGDAVSEASFFTDGCGTTIACASIVVSLAQGERIDNITQITKQAVLDALGGLPAEEEHCAELAASALQYAVRDYQTTPLSRRKRGRER